MTHSDSSAAIPADRDKIIIFDTTLRDGEQCPGATMTFEDKLEVAELLDTMGVDIIEAGFPIASIGDFEAVSAIAKRAKTATIAGLAPGRSKVISRAVARRCATPKARGSTRSFRPRRFISLIR